MEKTALITGITGQDGYYLASFLLEKGYKVYGMQRRTASNTVQRVLDLRQKYLGSFFLRYGDLTDSASLCKLIRDIQPDEVYNLGAQSHVQVSFENPVYTADVDALGTMRLLEVIRTEGLKGTRFYQASTSELYGKALKAPQNEATEFHPRSPYGVAKLMGFWAVRNYREAYGMFACNGILFNHESKIRGETFVTRKITKAVANIVKGKQELLLLGNLDAKRDWGFAGDFIEAMWLMLQQEMPDDYVIATGETRTVREFVEVAFREVGITVQWKGSDISEVGIDENGKVLVAVDPAYYRPAEVDLLLGDATKAKNVLGWQPKTSFKDLVQMMVEADLKEEVKR